MLAQNSINGRGALPALAARRWASNKATEKPFWRGLKEKISEELAKDETIQKNLTELKQTTKAYGESAAAKTVASAAQRVRAGTASSATVITQKLGAIGASNVIGKVAAGVSQSKAAQQLAGAGAKISESRVAQSFTKTVSSAKNVLLSTDEEDEAERAAARPDASTPGVSGSSALAVREEDTVWGKISGTRVGQSMLAVRDRLAESNNPVVRFTRDIASRTSEAVGDVVARIMPTSEAAVAVEEIRRLDPNFDPERLRRRLERFVLPDVMRALAANDVPALKSLVSEKLFEIMSRFPEAQANLPNMNILDISPLEPLVTKVVDSEPTMFFTYTAQQVLKGESKILAVQYIWAVQRDRKDPTLWQIVEMSALEPQEQLF